MNKKYKCPWPRCKEEPLFEREVEYMKGSKDARHKGVFSTQVRCPNCHNFLATWKREEIIDPITGRVPTKGRKHIHIRN